MISKGEPSLEIWIPSTSKEPSERWLRLRWVNWMSSAMRKAIPPPDRSGRSFLMRL